MAQGKWKSVLLGIQGLVGHRSAPDWGFIYSASLVKDAKWNVGDRVVLPDGRTFRYGKSNAALNVDMGCAFAEDEVSTYSTVSVANAVGDKSVSVTAVAHAALTEDELAGGYVIIFHTGGGGYSQFRGIVGNPAADNGATFTINLDGPIDHATIAASTGIEVFYNPYAALGNPASMGTAGKSIAGKPAVQITAASMYFWVQTWGPCWVSPSSSFSEFWDRGAAWRHDGSIEPLTAVGSLTGNETSQYAGFLIGEGYSSGPLLNLQVNP